MAEEKKKQEGQATAEDDDGGFAARALEAFEGGVASLWEGVKRAVPGSAAARPLAESAQLETLMVWLIIANTLVMALDYYGDSKTSTYDDVLNAFNYTFTFAFLGEMLFKVRRRPGG